MIVKLFPWLLGYVGLTLPVVAERYGAGARWLSRRTRPLVSRLKRRLLAALGRRLRQLLSEQSGSEEGEEPPGTIPLRPRP